MKRMGVILAILFLSGFTPLTLNPLQMTATLEAAMPDDGIFFRDDFTEELQPEWTWENEDPDKWTITDDGMLQIIGGHDSLIGHGREDNLLWHDLPEGDFVVSTHLIADPKENFQQAAIFLYEDAENFVAINHGFCGPCGGSGFYMEYKINSSFGAYKVMLDKTDVYLRLESKDNTISGYYATEPDKWTRLGRFGNYFQFKKVGLGVSNSGAVNYDLVGQYDWFEITTGL